MNISTYLKPFPTLQRTAEPVEPTYGKLRFNTSQQITHFAAGLPPRDSVHFGAERFSDKIPNLKIDLKNIFQTYTPHGRLQKKIELATALGSSPQSLDVPDENGSTLLIEAAKLGDLGSAEILLKKGANVNAANLEGWTPLHQAAFQNNPNMVSWLLSNGADVDPQFVQKPSPPNSGYIIVDTYESGELGPRDPDGSIVSSETDIPPSPLGETPLHWAARGGDLQVIQLLAQKGAKINAQDALGNTPLHIASDTGNLNGVKALLSIGAAVDIVNEKGQAPIHLAASSGKIEILEALKEKGADLSVKDKRGQFPIFNALEARHDLAVLYFLDQGVDPNVKNVFGHPLLHWAILQPNARIFNKLLEKNVNPNIENDSMENVLHSLASEKELFNDDLPPGFQDPNSFKTVLTNRIKTLLEKGVNIEHQEAKFKQTPLASAIAANNHPLFSLLMNSGAQWDLVSGEGETGIHIAVNNSNGYALTQLLDKSKETGKNIIDTVNKRGDTALMLTLDNPTPNSMVQDLLKEGASLTTVNKDGLTPLHLAFHNGRWEAAALFISKGADIHLPLPNGKTLVDYAALNLQTEQYNQLIQKGAQPSEFSKNFTQWYKAQESLNPNNPSVKNFIQLIPPLFEMPFKLLERFMWNIEHFYDYNYDKRGYHPNEAELMLLLKHPDLFDRDPDKTKSLSLALTSITRYIEPPQVELSDAMLKTWGDIGFLTHAYRFWRFDTMSVSSSSESKSPHSASLGKTSLFQEFGFKPAPETRPLNSIFGKGFLYTDPSSQNKFEFRRGYLLVTHPQQGTLIIRNSSTVFGRDLLKHPAYFFPKPLSEAEILKFDPRVLDEDTEQSIASWHILDKELYLNPKNKQAVSELTDALMGLKEEYRQFKLDTKSFEGYGSQKHFTGHLSPGFSKLIKLLSKLKLERPSQPLPDLAFVHPDFPAWQPYGTFKLTPPHLQELQAFISGTWNEKNYPQSEWIQFLVKAGVENRAELVMVEP
jgi:ankyrin repeat protein